MNMALPIVIQAVRWTHILAGFMAFFIKASIEALIRLVSAIESTVLVKKVEPS